MQTLSALGSMSLSGLQNLKPAQRTLTLKDHHSCVRYKGFACFRAASLSDAHTRQQALLAGDVGYRDATPVFVEDMPHRGWSSSWPATRRRLARLRPPAALSRVTAGCAIGCTFCCRTKTQQKFNSSISPNTY